MWTHCKKKNPKTNKQKPEISMVDDGIIINGVVNCLYVT